MSQIAMTIADRRRALHGRPHGSFADVVVAALSAEPETIEELGAALARFVEPARREELAAWSPGTCDEPFDAGICIVDLAARLVVVQSTYSSPGPKGEVLHPDPQKDRDVWLPYHVSDDWEFSAEVQGWAQLAEARRGRRAATPPLDARAVLYAEVAGFLVGECLAARGEEAGDTDWSPPEGWSLRELPERAAQSEKPRAEDAVAEIHARWLMTPREDLRGRSPREVLLARKEHVDWDLQDRCHHWAFLGDCAPGLVPESAAFRFGGFGGHENILYYDLVRYLAWECWERVVQPEAAGAPGPLAEADLVRKLHEARDAWLDSPDAEDLSGWTPRQVIDRERARLPMAVSGREAMVDEDCPLCQMMAEDMGPTFWHLDGCNMDGDFPFSFHPTRREWEKERAQWEDFNRRFEEKERKRREAGVPDEAPPWDDHEESPSPWCRSISNPDAGSEPPSIALFGIGSHVAELGVDLKDSPETAPLAPRLNGQFGNLRAAISDPAPALVEPVVERFCEELDSVSEARPDLAAKCADLQRQLHQFAARVSDEPEWDEDIPF